MVRELHRRQHSAILLIFPAFGRRQLRPLECADAELKCIATEDINQARFAQVVRRFCQAIRAAKKEPIRRQLGHRGRCPATSSTSSRGDRLGISLEEFKGKYNRSGEGGQRLPICSDTAWAPNKASLESETWHQAAKIIHARIDLPTENNSPPLPRQNRVAALPLHRRQAFRITAKLPTDQFHLVSEAAVKKYGPVTRETQKPRQLIWENPLASVVLTRGNGAPARASS